MPTYYAALSDRLLVGDGEWTERLVGETLECVAADPRAPRRAVVGTVDSGLQRTTDGGESWTEREGVTDLDSASGWSFPPRPHTHHVRWLAVAPDDPDTVVVSAARGARSAHATSGESYVYRTTGDGWAVAMAGLPDPDGLARAVLSADGDGFAALTNHGLFRSPEGVSWSRVGTWADAHDQVPRGLAVV